ncbi:murein biosynthesis integral membrane protein MurJ [Paenisporosarcina cavernae]|uniref:Murein biosynthesis integral membrane protein MurJ n=1 Tax=Paenisporosarcina cavernae TaxID=2320858 RepID=A0A385YQ85_9BACL|nr:murein biosynthesis integral membrane protein MurJ [Paenisporosarcina cavernae]AYC28909.1 murein biosynthesis integral membrane protein MurJ [Paenisporosarcina cavernae]
MSSLKKAAIWTTGLALLLKLSGFLREAIVAKEFGASAQTDGYFLAFGFITLVVAMIATGFNNVFLPMYVKRKKSGVDSSDQNANALLNWTMVVFIGISIVGWIFAPTFVPLIYGNMKDSIAPYAIGMTQVFFAFMTVIALTGLLDSYLQSRRIFVPSQLAKLLATLMAAVFALLFSDVWGIYSLVYGFIFGTIVGVVIQLIYLRKSDYKWKPDMRMEKDFQKAFLILIVPSLLNSVVGQINLFVNKAFASGDGVLEGSVTYLNNASLLISIPNAIYATTLAAIIFTLMSEQIDDGKKFRDTVFRGMEISFVTLLPITIGLFFVGEAALSFVYERGRFTDIDVERTFVALLWYLPIILFQGMQLILSKSMYARGKTAVVFSISVTTIAVNFAMNWFLVDEYGYPALAFAASVVSVYYFTVSLIVVYRDLGWNQLRRVGDMAWRVLIPGVVMGAVLYAVKMFLPEENWYSLIQLGVLVAIGVVVYVCTLRLIYPTGFTRMVNMIKR